MMKRQQNSSMAHRSANNVIRIGGARRMRRNARFLRKHPLCKRCDAKKPKRYTPAVEVDHIIPLTKGGTEDESNLQGLCKDCHEEKTNEDFNRKSWPSVGADGWPADRRDARMMRRNTSSQDDE